MTKGQIAFRLYGLGVLGLLMIVGLWGYVEPWLISADDSLLVFLGILLGFAAFPITYVWAMKLRSLYDAYIDAQ